MNGIIIVPTYAVSFERTSRRGYYIVTLDGNKRYIPSRLFSAVFPRIDRRLTVGSLEASAREIEALGTLAEIVDKHRYQIRYTVELGYDIYGRPCATNYIVNAVDLGQSIAITSAAFLRITGADKRATIGCMDVTAAQLDDLGFVRKEVAADVRNERPVQGNSSMSTNLPFGILVTTDYHARHDAGLSLRFACSTR